MIPITCTLPSIANAVGKVAGVAIFSPVGNQTLNASSYVQIGCDSGFALSGGSNMTCQANGTMGVWDQVGGIGIPFRNRDTSQTRIAAFTAS